MPATHPSTAASPAALHLTAPREACDLRTDCFATASLKEAEAAKEEVCCRALPAAIAGAAREADARAESRSSPPDARMGAAAAAERAPATVALLPAVASAGIAHAFTMVAAIFHTGTEVVVNSTDSGRGGDRRANRCVVTAATNPEAVLLRVIPASCLCLQPLPRLL